MRLDGMLVSDGREISELTHAEFDVPIYYRRYLLPRKNAA